MVIRMLITFIHAHTTYLFDCYVIKLLFLVFQNINKISENFIHKLQDITILLDFTKKHDIFLRKKDGAPNGVYDVHIQN